MEVNVITFSNCVGGGQRVGIYLDETLVNFDVLDDGMERYVDGILDGVCYDKEDGSVRIREGTVELQGRGAVEGISSFLEMQEKYGTIVWTWDSAEGEEAEVLKPSS